MIEDLTKGSVPAGSNLLVEFDPASQWYNAAATITAGWLSEGGKVDYNVLAQRPEDIRSQLNRFGLDSASLEAEGKFEIIDYYMASVGQKSTEKHGYDSLKVAELSIAWAKGMRHGPPAPECLRIHDNISSLARFNDDKSWTEFLLTRVIASSPIRRSTRLIGIAIGIHSEWVYKTLETAVEGVVDFRLDEVGESTVDMIRIRSMRNVGFDRNWHQLQRNENLEVALEK